MNEVDPIDEARHLSIKSSGAPAGDPHEERDGDDLDAGAISQGDAVDDGLQTQERKDVVVELGIVKTVRPRLIRARPSERRHDEKAHEDDEEYECTTHRAGIPRKDRAAL